MASSQPPRQSRSRGTPRLSADERRAQIIETAAGAFLAAGFDGTAMEEVARNAGISRVLLYRNFDHKRHLYRAVLASVTDEFVAGFQDRGMADIRRHGGIVGVALGIARRHPDAFRLLWRHAAHEPAFADFARNFRLVVGQYAEAMIAIDGRVTEPHLRRWCATSLATHLLDGICTWLDEGDRAHDDEFAVLQTCGLFAMVDAWGDPHPPAWLQQRPAPDGASGG
jgi:AcrR family transcriptional regulator